MNSRFDLVDTYFSAIASTPIKVLVLYAVYAFGAAFPSILGGVFDPVILGLWPFGIYISVFTWGILMPVAGVLLICLFGCLYNYLFRDITLSPLFIGFSICYILTIRAAGDNLWIAVVIYAAMLSLYIFLPPIRAIREYEKDCI